MHYFVESQIHSNEYSTWRSVVHHRVSFCVIANGAFTIEGIEIYDSETQDQLKHVSLSLKTLHITIPEGQ